MLVTAFCRFTVKMACRKSTLAATEADYKFLIAGSFRDNLHQFHISLVKLVTAAQIIVNL